MEKNKEGEEKKEELMLMILRNLSAQFLPITVSSEELAKADSILVIRGTMLEIFLNLKHSN